MLHARLRAAAGRDRIPTDGLVAAYDLDSNLIDKAGGFDGTAVSTASYTAGVVGQALDGDGSNYVSLPNLGISGSTPRTISFWIKRGPTSSIKTALAWSPDVASTRESCIVHVNVSSAGDIYWAFSGDDYRTAGGLITTSSYSHVCLVYQGGTLSTSSIMIFHNNISKSLTKAGSGSGQANTSDNNYRIMSDKFGPRIFDGDIDLVRLYNRALSVDEVDQLYSEGA